MTIGKSRKKLKKLIHGKANVLAEVGEYDNATDVVGHDVNGKGDSVLVCWVTGLSLPVYRDFIHGTAQPTRSAWAETRYWYMSSLAKGREWMEERAKTRIHKSLIFVETSRFQVQKDSLKDYRKEKLTPTEIRNNKMYLKDNCLYK